MTDGAQGAALRYRSYRWRGADEWLAEIGTGPPVLIAPPLFEELNRCRALLAGVMRGIAAAGFHAVLPDLPGTGESPRALTETVWDDWTGALGLVSFDLKARSEMPFLASFRGGCLLEEQAAARASWRFAPVAGSALTRDLLRARQATLPDRVRTDDLDAHARAQTTEFAGYAIPPSIYAPLAAATIYEEEIARTVRLETDPGAADLKLAGKPLWRQSEPGNDRALAAALATDIVAWVRSCAD